MTKVTDAYYEAMNTGRYDRDTGLVGKYDNVRQCWEDAITGMFIRPYLETIIAEKKRNLKRLRILDLGCGSGDGFELLRTLTTKAPSIYEYEVNIIASEILGMYTGTDINEKLIDQGREIYRDNGKVNFTVADFTKGLPKNINGDDFYDLYFTSYGTLSHLTDEQLIKLLVDIAEYTKDHSIVIGDWLGRYSYEWQNLWTRDPEEFKNMDYVISYLQKPFARRQKKKVESFSLRLMQKEELEQLIKEANNRTDANISIENTIDRSIFVGRHMDTGEYNPYCQPIRRAVNSLHETNVRTDLYRLMIDYYSQNGLDFLNKKFEMFQMAWNTLVSYTISLIGSYDDEKEEYTEEIAIPHYYPEQLQNSMRTMQRVVDGVGWLRTGDPRANIIEPQLGYALRSLEMNFQDGSGMGHGFLAALRITK